MTPPDPHGELWGWQRFEAVALGTVLSWRHRFVVIIFKIVFNALRLSESRAGVSKDRKEETQDLRWLEAGRRERTRAAARSPGMERKTHRCVLLEAKGRCVLRWAGRRRGIQ